MISMQLCPQGLLGIFQNGTCSTMPSTILKITQNALGTKLGFCAISFFSHSLARTFFTLMIELNIAQGRGSLESFYFKMDNLVPWLQI